MPNMNNLRISRRPNMSNTTTECEIVHHPLAQIHLTRIRNRETGTVEFRNSMHKIGSYLAIFAAEKFLPMSRISIDTPLCPTSGLGFDPKIPIYLVPILRSGLSFVDGILNEIPSAVVSHLGYRRNEKTLVAELYLDATPLRFSDDARVLISEPMLATGGTLASALGRLIQKGLNPQNIAILTALSSAKGSDKILKAFPGVRIFTLAVDPTLNDQGFIVPGLGDAGDRACGIRPE
jgi:uracil phosphoribosyltransferase